MLARYGVLASDPGCTLVSLVIDALRGHTCQLVQTDAAALCPTANWEVLLLVIDAAGYTAALSQIASLHRHRPGATLLAVVDGLDREQLAAILEAGVCDFVTVPFLPFELHARVSRWQPLYAPSHATTPQRLRDFVGQSPSFMRQMTKLPAYAACDAGILIMGETGTGKEVCAQAIHYLSPRADRPWVAVNCGAIPNELVEDELFGHVKGAYTTALAPRSGLVREAEGGTLFLDDIDCLPLSAQAKLLRFLQEREYRLVGSNQVHRANVRVIAASNQQLQRLAVAGRFRQDLYYRLNVLTLELPPLRERKEDIPALALHFLRRFALQFDRRLGGLAPAALKRLLSHDWPGNVRELQHVIERAAILSRGPLLEAGDVEIDALGADAPALDSFQQAKARVVEQFERRFIEQLLAAHDGNVTHAAQAAQKNRRAFFELMRKHRIEPQRFRSNPF